MGKTVTTGERRFAGLDLLRVAAALALMICHAGFWLAPFAWPVETWFLLGHLGVEVFLVCAGFLAARRALAAPSFAAARSIMHGVLRLWPLYALFLVVNVLLGPVGTMSPPSLLPYVVLGQNLAWPHPAFFGEAWIVAAAMLLVVCVPLLGARLRRMTAAQGMLLLIGGIVLGWTLRALVVVASDPEFDTGVRKILALRLDLPFYGVLLAWLAVHAPVAWRRWRAPLAVVGSCVLLLVGWIHLAVALDGSTFARVVLPGLCDLGWALLVPWAAQLAMAPQPARLLATGADAAYAGLLSHMTSLRVLAVVGVPLLAASRGQGLGLLAAYLAGATLVALAIDRFIDRPWRHWLDRRFAQRLPPVAER